jgi:uridylate kinase
MYLFTWWYEGQWLSQLAVPTSAWKHMELTLDIFQVVEAVAKEIAAAYNLDVQVAVVVGGGNYWRGADAKCGIDRASADYVGMLATVMNAVILQVCLLLAFQYHYLWKLLCFIMSQHKLK